MSAAMLLKIFSDCCVCFAILGSGPVEFSTPLLLPALVCGLAAGIATFFDGKGLDVLRRISATLPFACLFFAESGMEGLLLAVPAVYTAVVIIKGQLHLEYSNYRHFFVRSLMLVGGVFIVANIWMFLTQLTNEAILQMDTAVILRYGLVHLLCGVVLQRQLRLGVGYRAEGGRRQMATLLITATTIVVGFLAAEPLLRQGLGALLRQLLALILAPFGYLLSVAGRLLAHLGNTNEDKKTYQEFLDYWETVMGDMGGGGTGQAKPQPEEVVINPDAIWAAVAGIFLLVAVVLLLRSFYKRRGEFTPSDATSGVVTAPKKKKESTFSNRARVRQMYRDFLRTEKDLGMKLRKSDTSADVLGRIHPRTDAPSAEALRQVYLLARYDDRQNITRAQVEDAKRALKGTHLKK